MDSVIFMIRATGQGMKKWNFYGKGNQESGRMWNSKNQDMVREEVVGEHGLVKIL